MGKVSVYKCSDYEYEKIKHIVFKSLEYSEISRKIFKNAKIFIKANLLMKKDPEDAVTTHPNLVRALSEFFIEKGCIVTIGDSPAGPFTENALKGIYSSCKMDEAANLSGAVLNYNITHSEVKAEESLRLKSFRVINAILESDFVISAAKLKTHGMMTYTGGVKNLFGVIPGLIKAEYHFKLTSEENFAHHLIDICEFIKPDYTIIDAIDCMEGNGPSNGQKRRVGLIIGGDNPHEADYIASQIASIPFYKIPTLSLAKSRNLYDVSSIVIEGDDYGDMDIKPFTLPESTNITFISDKIPGFLREYLIDRLKAKPKFIHQKCISCGHCVRNCPAKVIKMENKLPIVDLKGCISCFCCHEVCPADAIEIKRPILSKLFLKIK